MLAILLLAGISIIISPPLMRKLIIIHLGSGIVGTLLTFILLILYDAGKGGSNEGMFEELSIYLLIYLFASTGTMLIGVLAGVLAKVIK